MRQKETFVCNEKNVSPLFIRPPTEHAIPAEERLLNGEWGNDD
jgi:hypothetical protein